MEKIKIPFAFVSIQYELGITRVQQLLIMIFSSLQHGDPQLE